MNDTDVRSDDMSSDVPVLVDPDLTKIVMILDRSGSMESARESTISAFNEFVREQRALPGAASLKLIQFDDQYEEVFDKPLQEVPEMTQSMFQPRGWTALYDAQGKAITTLKGEIEKLPGTERPAKVVFVTITDGMNNRSKEYTQKSVADLIEKMKSIYKWQFIYLGANQDAVAVGSSMNYAVSNTMSYDTAKMGRTMSAMSASISGLRSMTNYTSSSNEEIENAMAFTPEQRKQVVSSDPGDSQDPVLSNLGSSSGDSSSGNNNA